MSLLYSLTLFLSAFLVFIIQPLVGKLLLPTLGGSAALWNVCMVFFQALLLGGYLYGHLSMKWLTPERQALVHGFVLLLPLLALPIALSPELARTVPADADPTIWLLGVLFLVAGLPFFVISTSAPVFQRWFSHTDHKDRKDPYFLYAASNAGSITGLFFYPLILERTLTVEAQSQLWTLGYFLFLVLALGSAVALFRSRGRMRKFQQAMATALPSLSDEKATPLTWRRRGLWILLAMIPSSLMLGLTTYITTDIASVPLLWVIPLGLYLLSFIFVFARRPLYLPWWMGRGMGLIAVVLLIAFLNEVTQPASVIFGMHLAFYFVAIMVAHGRLAKDRPPASQLTEYFLLISFGGVLGGIFNALIAPLIFTHIYEYTIMIALACMVRALGPGEGPAVIAQGWRRWRGILATPLLVIATTLGVIALLEHFAIKGDPTLSLLFFGIPAVIACTQIARPFIFGLAMLALLATGSLYTGYYGAPLAFERNFYGTVRIVDDQEGRFRSLVDGNTVHGRMLLDDPGCTPLSYYTATGPAGQVFADFHRRTPMPDPAQWDNEERFVGVIGMGIGSLACYGRPHEHWDLFELNPLVIDVATDERFFSLLDRAPTGSQTIYSGDGRLRLQDMRSNRYDILVIDAFSSGSIPVHLLTREAFQLYDQKLAPRGVLLIHISNRLFELSAVIANLAASIDYYGVVFTDGYVSQRDQEAGKDPSIWAILSADETSIDAFFRSTHPGIEALSFDPSTPVWTDSYSDIIAPLLRRPALDL